MRLIDDSLLAAFAESFYGYGNYEGRCWFIGMEEGGGNSIVEIARRLKAWDERGRRELEDLCAFHQRIGEDRWFGQRKIQPTWRGLIRIYLRAAGRPITTETIREYQCNELGVTGGDTTLMELLPLPAPSLNHWLYADCSTVECLKSRSPYQQAYAPLRIQHLQKRIRQHRPKAVVFYGKAYLEWWEMIAGIKMRVSESGSFYRGSRDGVEYATIAAPTAMGLAKEYFHVVGDDLSAYLVCSSSPQSFFGG